MRYVWREAREDEPPKRVLIVVPKKRIRKAVDRHRIKRQLREVYRLNKALIENPKPGQTMLIAMVYQGSISPEYKDLETSFHKMAESMKAKIDKP
jgi:ribonuclease P protein component